MSNLAAVSDLHVSYQENREIVESIQPETPEDWLLVAGDVGERMPDVEWALGLLRDRFAKVVWVPGNHELWTIPDDPVQLRGVERYEALVEMCRGLDVVTPEDPYPTWRGQGGPVTVVPLFLGYDYTWRPEGTSNKTESLAYAHSTGVVCTDEYMLHPDPYPTREDWCRARVAETERRLKECDQSVPMVFVNHYPLVRDPTHILRYPEFAQWCGTNLTADWHVHYPTAAMVYGHLHIPRATTYDGVPFTEVSLGYPREWRPRKNPPQLPRRILPTA
ncbi:metallophosphoesterase family protein [Actinophytocola oryzae]|uniref:3',5'-cyclic AMP phosphodiesterase CpdA n=1 Tax=Actinophytocola oryzae TaxID=502181 RepID=A0A4V3FQ17_9PSEU|nr:metallophosphoesterase [Actinophytocola oryzae]TDV34519.1 3',5'-cyclic AMP phosphodiesterase CpdA [Actinophytocola oryzae]